MNLIYRSDITGAIGAYFGLAWLILLMGPFILVGYAVAVSLAAVARWLGSLDVYDVAVFGFFVVATAVAGFAVHAAGKAPARPDHDPLYSTGITHDEATALNRRFLGL